MSSEPSDSSSDDPDRRRFVVLTGVMTLVWVGWILVLGLGARQRVVGVSNDAAEPVQHFVGFLVLGALVALLVRWPPVVTIAVLIGLGLIGELAQLAVDGRSFGLEDLSWDAVGATLGVGLVIALRRRRVAAIGVPVIAAVLLAVTPWLLVNSTPVTSFPDRCFDAPPAVDRAATMILDVPGLPSDEFPVVVDPSMRQEVRRALVQTNELTVETWFETTDLGQRGPARMFTISDSPSLYQANLHLGIHFDNIVVRLRTACELVNEVVLDGVVIAGQRHHLLVTWSAGELTVWLDGEIAHRQTLPWGDFKQWNPSFPIAVGDEAGGGRRFDGTIHAVRMWDVALPADEIVRRSQAVID